MTLDPEVATCASIRTACNSDLEPREQCVKFSNAGGLVQVKLSRQAERVEIRVSDNGQGISADFCPISLNAFARRMLRPAGSIPAWVWIVDRQKLGGTPCGQITAQSDGEGGAVFTVLLPMPRLPEHLGADAPSAAARPFSASAGADSACRRC